MTIANIFIGMNNTFAGLIARPNQIGTFLLSFMQGYRFVNLYIALS